MASRRTLRTLENIHIPLWLIKDTCWMLEFKWLGTMMIVPTLTMAIYIVIKTMNRREVFINLAICCWVSANAWWMCCEFFQMMPYKNLSIIPFLSGMVLVAYYYLRPTNAEPKVNRRVGRR
jgi:hypothetical protein